MAICMIDNMLKTPRQMQLSVAIIPAANMVAEMTITIIVNYHLKIHPNPLTNIILYF